MFSFAARSLSFQLTYFFANLRNFCPDFFASLPPKKSLAAMQNKAFRDKIVVAVDAF